MKTVQKSRDGHSAGFSHPYSSPSGKDKQCLSAVFTPAWRVMAVLIVALAFTACRNFISLPPASQTEQGVPSFKEGGQNTLTIEPPSAQVGPGSITTFRAIMGGHAAGVKWTFAGEVSPGTEITDGILVVAEDESNTTITIIATLNSNSKYQARASVIVEAPSQQGED